MIGGRTLFGAGTGLVLSLPRIEEALSGNKNAWFSVGGSIAGGILGAMTGNPALALVGSRIGESFVNSVLSYKGEIGKAFVPVITQPPAPVTETLPPQLSTRESQINLAVERAIQAGLLGSNAVQQWFLVMQYQARKALGMETTYRGGIVQYPEKVDLRSIAITAALDIIEQYESGRGRVGRYQITRETYELAKQLINAVNQAQGEIKPTKAIEDTAIQKLITAFAQQNSRLISEIYKIQTTQLNERFFGNIYSLADYRRVKQNLVGVGGLLGQYGAITQLRSVEELRGVNEELIKALPNAQKFVDIFVQADQESASQLSDLISSITELSTKIESANGGLVEFEGQTLSNAEAVEQLNFFIRMFLEVLGLVEQKTQGDLANKIISLIPKAVDLRQIEDLNTWKRVLARAFELQKEDFGEIIAAGILSEEQVNTLIANAEPLMVRLGKALGTQITKGLTDSNYLTQAFKDLQQTGQITVGLDYQFLSVTKAQFESIMSQYNQIREAILRMGGTSEETPLLTFFKDSNNPYQYSKDWKIVQYLLSQILDTEKKQLDGIYNLPSEASAWIPFQTLQYAYNKGLNEAGGTPNFAPLDDATQNTANNLNQLALTAGQTADALRYLAMYNAYKNTPLNQAQTAEAERWKTIYDFWKQQLLLREDEKRPTVIQPQTPIERPAIENLLPDTWLGMLDRERESLFTGVLNTLSDLPTKIKEGLQQLPFDLGNILQNILQTNQFNPPNVDIAKRKDQDLILPTTQVPQVSTNLKLDINSTTNLVVDGRTLATVVKNYIWEDLIRYVNAVTSTTQSYTIV
jgi:hypothetical protein